MVNASQAPVHAKRPRHPGNREITDTDLEGFRAEFGYVAGFHPQFATREIVTPLFPRLGWDWVPPPVERPAWEGARNWLAANATGPWRFTVGTWAEAYVEREPDRERFLRLYGSLFRHSHPHPHDLDRLAVVRGALPRRTTGDSFRDWEDANLGYRKLNEGLPDAEGRCRLTFTHPGVEAAFEAEFMDSFEVVGLDGETLEYACHPSARNAHGVHFLSWLSRHCCIGSRNVGPGAAGYVIETRFADVASSLERDWGHVFSPAPGEPGAYVATEYPRVEARRPPDDFMDYLSGVRQDYATPHLPVAFAPAHGMRLRHAGRKAEPGQRR